jgi:Flp pilus assembly protein TadD
MKKAILTLLVSGLLFTTGLEAQTLQDGINHLNADRFKSAIAVFEKLLATNPNNIEATYWLGQTYFDMDENANARKVYDKALASNGNAPLILVGEGHADLLDKKTGDARQRFDAAIIASHGKKGDDPAVLTAIGRANVDAKAGDFNYAIEKLEASVLRDANNPETYMQLGNAYRKAHPGEGGGKAFESYKKALEVRPDFAVVDVRLAKLFESQKNWEFVLQYLNDAITRDPKFAPAYYELFYYYFFREKYPEAEEQLKKYVTVTDDQVANDYLYAQLCYGHKDYDCAITKAVSVAAALGTETKPKVYKLLAYSYFAKGDSINAKKNIDSYFAKERPEGYISKDYELLANILAKTGGSNEDVKNAYLKGADIDTVLTSKIDFLKAGAEFFKTRGDSLSRITEGDIRQQIIKLKPNPSQRDYFDAGLAYYQGKDYIKSDSIFSYYTQKWPDEVFGWQMEFSIQRAKDTAMTLGLAVPPGIKYLEVLEKDTAKNKKTIIGLSGYLAQYYANIAKDREKAIVYLEKMVMYDPTNADFKKYLDDMKKPAPVKKNGPNPGPNVKPKR